VMSERELNVPRLGRIEAAPGFRLVSAMNPFDAVGTARISGAVYDRVCRIAVDYQSVADETMILRRETAQASPGALNDVDASWRDGVVELVRLTRNHSDLRIGSSIRGAIDMVLVANSLAQLRDATPYTPSVSLDAALVALSGRVRLREGTSRTSEDVIRELWESVFGRSQAEGEDGEGKDGAPTRGMISS
jgi:MoxR-like ATPase